MRKLQILMVVGLLVLFCAGIALAQTVPPSQTGGALQRQEQDLQRMEDLERRVTTPRKKTQEPLGPEQLADDTGEKILITRIVVEGATLLSNDILSNIIARFEGKELSLRGMQMAADLITDEYRKKGYVTSRAYIPPQTLKEGLLIIRVVEGKLGKIEFRENRFFKTRTLSRGMKADRQGYFDYRKVQDSLAYLNEHPDRQVKAVLVPGQEPGTTDIVVEVKDRLPIHIGLTYDNFLSRYLGETRVISFVEHNNLLGFDDRLRIEWQQSRDSWLRARQGRYTFPLRPGSEIGLFMAKNVSRLGREFEIINSRSKAFLTSIFYNQKIVSSEILDVRFVSGFDYKDIQNYLINTKTSEDRVRIAKFGFDIDANDPWARNIFSFEYNIGIPHIMGGMDSKSSSSSRSGSGAGGKFQKGVFSYFRLQPGPWETNFLWKNLAQATNHNLVAGEQFQIGGPGSVRGYPVGEFSGDSGIYSSIELTTPIYMIPRSWTLPKTRRSLYDSLRFLAFYDWGMNSTKTPTGGQRKNDTLRACGLGLRMDLGQNFSARIELGYPLSNAKPSNGKNVQSWFEIIARF